MRAVVVPQPGRLALVETPEPVYGEYEALVEILSCSICSGTDSHILEGSFPLRRYPAILGHESIGQVVAVGYRVRSFQRGDLVLRPCAVRPGETLGGYQSMFGGFAELGVVADGAAIIADCPRGQEPVLPPYAQSQQIVPRGFEPRLAGALITFKETLSFLQHMGVRPGQSVLILGSGTVGLSFVLAAKLCSAYPVMVTGRRPEPLQRALAYGADQVIDTSTEDLRERVLATTDGRGAELAVEAVGDWEVCRSGLAALADGGQMGIYGVAADRAVSLDSASAPRNWSLCFKQPREQDVHRQALEFMRLGLLDLTKLVSHTVSLSDIEHGFELVRRKEALKVVVQMRGSS